MRSSNTGLSHGTSGSPQESIESLEYGAKVQEIEAKLKEELGQQEYSMEALSNLGNIEHFTEGAIKHIFEGELNNRGDAKGYHYEGIENTVGTLVPGTRTAPNPNGVYRGNVKVSGVSKIVFSTFFPREWSPQQVINSINQAYETKKHLSGNRYYGYANGVKIEMFISSNGKIISAFPKE